MWLVEVEDGSAFVEEFDVAAAFAGEDDHFEAGHAPSAVHAAGVAGEVVVAAEAAFEDELVGGGAFAEADALPLGWQGGGVGGGAGLCLGV